MTLSPSDKIVLLRRRDRVLRLIRAFFHKREYVEMEVRLLQPTLIPESSIEAVSTVYRPLNKKADELNFLIPSPEIAMKRAIADGIGSVFCITPVFRNCEEEGAYHRREFTMLEWYGVSSDYKENGGIAEELIRILLTDEKSQNAFPRIERVTMQELFYEYLGSDLEVLLEGGADTLRREAVRLGEPADICGKEDEEELFNRIFAGHIEGQIASSKRSLFIFDYPSCIPTLAKRAGIWAQRWELYLRGVEVANCYTEENCFDELKRYFVQEEGKVAAHHRKPAPVDPDLPSIFSQMPEVSGVALGVDRLLAAIWNSKSIKETMSPY